jgi:hypothetical protein
VHSVTSTGARVNAGWQSMPLASVSPVTAATRCVTALVMGKPEALRSLMAVEAKPLSSGSSCFEILARTYPWDGTLCTVGTGMAMTPENEALQASKPARIASPSPASARTPHPLKRVEFLAPPQATTSPGSIACTDTGNPEPSTAPKAVIAASTVSRQAPGV